MIRRPIRLPFLLVVLALLAGVAAPRAAADATLDFGGQVDLEPLRTTAVHWEGRVRSFDSHAAQVMRFVSGPRRIDDRAPAYTYLDMLFRPERYRTLDCVYVKNRLVRAELRTLLEASADAQLAAMEQGAHAGLDATRIAGFRDELRTRMERFQETGLIAPAMLADDGVQARLAEMSADVLRTAREVESLRSAVTAMRPEFLGRNLAVLAPPAGGFDDAWHTLDELAAAPDSEMFAALPAEVRDGLVAAWADLRAAWTREDAPAASAAIARLGALLPRTAAEPGVYPESRKLAWESWYFRSRNMVWTWIVYALALVPLLLHVVFRWPAARLVGMGLFGAAFALHTVAVGLRWYVAGRWPNSNMFEAVTTAAWFGSAFAVLLEPFLRRTSLRGFVAIPAAASSAVALMCAHFFPMQLDPNISNMMPVLHDVWLYIHTNVIIFSYCLIFMAAVAATLYLVLRAVLHLRGETPPVLHARAGGAASLIMTGPSGSGRIASARAGLAEVLDGTTMILLELSFVLLWAGIIMGAIWADHSWGRPWGWDPKEVFALNTFIVFAVLVHLRFKVRDKGLWTAIVAVIGAAVMIFNWVIINFTIAGLHSYA